MKQFTLVIASILLVLIESASNSTSQQQPQTTPIKSVFEQPSQAEEASDSTQRVTVTVSGIDFILTLAENETTGAFIERLPLTIRMSELNSNEKYYYMSDRLPSESFSPGQIHAGDLMLYGNDCLVLFYDSFSSGYSYTPIGSIDNPDGLAKAVGSKSVDVTFSINQSVIKER